MNILITGGNGYIAKSLYNNLKEKYNITLITRQDFDLTNSKAVSDWFSDKYFDVVIHTAVVGGSRLKSEDSSIIDQNLQMYYNLLLCKDKYNKFIHFGSGAEIYLSNTPYGLSKLTISESIKDKDNFFNLRIFGVFDENELNTRFIKTCIKNYINKQPIKIYEDRYMDFFYMQDLISLVEYYIINSEDILLKDINLSYEKYYRLSEIAEFVNDLDQHKVLIDIETKENSSNYVSSLHSPNYPNIKYIGLKQGIIETYNKLKNEY
jgi:nucleoside-diphosphate-sugar epimerase